jgi:hypothetical protein
VFTAARYYVSVDHPPETLSHMLRRQAEERHEVEISTSTSACLQYSDIYDLEAALEQYLAAFLEAEANLRTTISEIQEDALNSAFELLRAHPPYEARRRLKELQRWFYEGSELLGRTIHASVTARARAKLMRDRVQAFQAVALGAGGLAAFLLERGLRARYPELNHAEYNPLLAALVILWIQNMLLGEWAKRIKKRYVWFIFQKVRRTLDPRLIDLEDACESWKRRAAELIGRTTRETHAGRNPVVPHANDRSSGKVRVT